MLVQATPSVEVEIMPGEFGTGPNPVIMKSPLLKVRIYNQLGALEFLMVQYKPFGVVRISVLVAVSHNAVNCPLP